MRWSFLLLLLLSSCRLMNEVPSLPPEELRWEPVEVPALRESGLRALSLPAPGVLWIAGSSGVCVTSADGGETWRDVSPPEAVAAGLDLRSLHAFGAERAIAVSAGPGEASRIFSTQDGGASWQTVHSNLDPAGFFDSVAFFDDRTGVCFGDPTAEDPALGDQAEKRLTLLVTRDGGESWERVPADRMPAGIEGEAGFAASNGCLTLREDGFGCIGTGGIASRVLCTEDYGTTWTAVSAPLRAGGTATGIFALEVNAGGRGIAVGGEYTDPTNATESCAFTSDGGRTWTLAMSPPRGYRSSVTQLSSREPPRETSKGNASWIAVGITGTDVSLDSGRTWQPIAGESDLELNAVRVVPGGDEAWAVGPKGRVVRMAFR